MGGDRDLRAAWAELRGQDRHRSEVPDIINLADRHGAHLLGEPAERGRATLFPSPKGGAGVRWLALLDPADHAELRAVVGRLAARIEPTLGPAVLANRSAGGPVLRLEPWRTARRRWWRAVTRLAREPGVLLAADVRDCYPAIAAGVVEETLLRMGCHPTEVGSLRRLLLEFRRQGVPGLPVGPEPSGVLANAVLARVDRALGEEGCRFLRWVDDLLVLARDRPHAERVLERLRAALRDLGLALAEEKTRVAEGPRDRAALIRTGVASARGTSAPGPPTEGTFEALSRRPRPEQARDHLDRLRDMVRGLAQGAPAERAGRAERDVLLAVAGDEARPGPVRAWAWRVLGRADPRTCLEAASDLDGEPDPSVRRALVAAAGLIGTPAARRFLKHVRTRAPDLGAVARWGLRR